MLAIIPYERDLTFKDMVFWGNWEILNIHFFMFTDVVF